MVETRSAETVSENADTTPLAPCSLAELEQALARDFELLGYPRRDWRAPLAASDGSGQKVLDVLIVGAGQGGLGTAFGLMREKIFNIRVIDQNPVRQEGPWNTFARMITLRTPKYLTGIDYGIPNLTFQAWYEAQYGAEAWAKVDLIPKELWADYLYWYRTFLGIPVQNDTRAGAIEWNPDGGYFEVPVNHAGKDTVLRARKVVLATGIDGSGQWQVPRFVSENLPGHLYAHTRQDIDFEQLKGKRIGVLGAGASAFDNASVALERGAKEVRLFFRRKELPNVNAYRWAEFVGFLKHHGDLPDAERWRFILQILRMGQLPPADTLARAKQFDHFHLHAGCSWDKLEHDGQTVKITTPDGVFEFDFLIIGTGFVTDLSLRPELEKLHVQVALWSDLYTPPESERHDDLGRHPYLGPHFEFQEKTAGSAPYLRSIFNYTFGCLISLGFGGASISGLKYSLPRLVEGITEQLYRDDAWAYFDTLKNFNEREF